MLGTDKVLCILYSSGGIPDVGRHAVRAALDLCSNPLRILTADPTTLEEANWNCGCNHSQGFTEQERTRMDVRIVDFTKPDPDAWKGHLQGVGAVISALGNRQPLYGDRVGAVGTKQLVEAMETEKVERVVSITSVGINDDWPPIEFHFVGNVLRFLFLTLARPAYNDLKAVEDTLTSASPSLDYLIIRPMGLGEVRKPKGEWFVQKEKYKDKVGFDMSKLDCARFAVHECLNPSYHKRAVVVGSNWENFDLKGT